MNTKTGLLSRTWKAIENLDMELTLDVWVTICIKTKFIVIMFFVIKNDYQFFIIGKSPKYKVTEIIDHSYKMCFRYDFVHFYYNFYYI